MSEPRMAVMTSTRITVAMPRRRASIDVKRVRIGARWVNTVAGSVAVAVMSGEIGAREGGGDEAAHDLAVGPTTRPRREPAHDLAQVAGRRGPGGGDALVHERLDLRLAERLRQVLGEDVDLRLLLGREVLASGLGVGVDRFA